MSSNANEPEEAEDGSNEGGGKMAKVKGLLGKIKDAASSSSSSGSGGSSSRQDEASMKESQQAMASHRHGPVVRKTGAKRTLYCANVGDARAVIS
jgi:serine/threonine protein phosphatase PrpC